MDGRVVVSLVVSTVLGLERNGERSSLPAISARLTSSSHQHSVCFY